VFAILCGFITCSAAPLSSVSTHACSIEALSCMSHELSNAMSCSLWACRALVATLLETGIFLSVQIPSIHMEIGKRFPCRPSVPRQGITDMDNIQGNF
jgi:hypothetical protein